MRFASPFALCLSLLVSAACTSPSPRQEPLLPAVGGQLSLVETVPAETQSERAWPRTAETWLQMIEGAQVSLELAHFYASSAEGSRLNDIIAAVEAAADRCVTVRFLADERFHSTYPEILDRFHAYSGIEVRRVDLRDVTGGVQHAKYMIVDGEHVFVGSPNFDWRSLEHIVELGVRLRSKDVASAFTEIFDWDWALAGGASLEDLPPGREVAWPQRCHLVSGDVVNVTPVASPKGLLPDPSLWDLPYLQRWIDEAETSVDLQFLSYKANDRDGSYSPDLDAPLRRAAARGVPVRLLVSHWNTGPGSVEGLQSLACLPGIEVRFVTIPEASSGFVPFSRVHHAKQIVVDRARAWVGTSNAQGDYFYKSRNVGLLLEGAAVGSELAGFFESYWESPFTKPVVPGKAYEAPRVSK